MRTMISLLYIELLKYRRIGLLTFALHLLALGFINTQGGNVVTGPLFLYWLILALIAVIAFAMVQMSSHKRGNQWIYLLHRPIDPKKILISLVLAALTLITVAIVLPFGLVLALVGLQGDFIVELRHFRELLVTMVALFAAYLAGAFASLNPQRFVLAALLLVMADSSNYIGSRYTLIIFILLLWFFCALYHSFKYDYNSPATSAGQLALFELPIQFGMLLVTSMIAYAAWVIFWMITATTPYVYPEPGSSLDYVLQAPQERLTNLLEISEHPDASFLAQQVEIGEIMEVSWPNHLSFPQRNQRPGLDNKLHITDSYKNANWRFSHTAMLFRGNDIDTGELVGWLTPTGFSEDEPLAENRFASVPWVVDNEFIFNETSIYQLDWNRRELRLRFSLEQQPYFEAGEKFSDSLTVSENVSTLYSNTHFYIFRSEELREPDSELRVRSRLESPPMMSRNLLTNVVELIDGYLVLFMGRIPNPIGPLEDFASFHRGEFLIYRSDESLANELILFERGGDNYSNSFIYSGFVAAPGMRLFVDFGLGLFLNKDAERMLPLFYFKFPTPVLVLALAVSLLSALLTHLLLRGLKLPAQTRRFWIVANAFSGLLGLLSMAVGLYWNRLRSSRLQNASPPMADASLTPAGEA